MYQICFRDVLSVDSCVRIVRNSSQERRIALEASFLAVTALHHDSVFDGQVYIKLYTRARARSCVYSFIYRYTIRHTLTDTKTSESLDKLPARKSIGHSRLFGGARRAQGKDRNERRRGRRGKQRVSSEYG